VNDYQFLRNLGSNVGMDLDSGSSEDAGKLLFRKPDLSSDPKVVICREKKDPPEAKHVLNAEFRLSTVQQVARVEVRGWDSQKKEPILGVAEEVSEAFDGLSGAQTAGKAHYGAQSTGRVLTVIDLPVACQEEADNLAASIFDRQALDFMTADVAIQGVPEVTAGDVVELRQFGKRYSGRYLVDAAQHLVVSGTKQPYQTRLHLVRNSAPEG